MLRSKSLTGLMAESLAKSKMAPLSVDNSIKIKCKQLHPYGSNFNILLSCPQIGLIGGLIELEVRSAVRSDVNYISITKTHSTTNAQIYVNSEITNSNTSEFDINITFLNISKNLIAYDVSVSVININTSVDVVSIVDITTFNMNDISNLSPMPIYMRYQDLTQGSHGGIRPVDMTSPFLLLGYQSLYSTSKSIKIPKYINFITISTSMHTIQDSIAGEYVYPVKSFAYIGNIPKTNIVLWDISARMASIPEYGTNKDITVKRFSLGNESTLVYDGEDTYYYLYHIEGKGNKDNVLEILGEKKSS